jgi:GT2 family glycosyltransferase
MSAIDVTVIVPALNERENIIIAIPQIRKIVEKLGITAEILIVDGNSSDGTREAAEALGARVVVQKERSTSISRKPAGSGCWTVRTQPTSAIAEFFPRTPSTTIQMWIGS